MKGEDIKNRIDFLNKKLKDMYSTFELKADSFAVEAKEIANEIYQLKATCPHEEDEAGFCKFCGTPLWK